MSSDFTSGEIANNDPFGMPIDDHEVEHFGARVHSHSSTVDFLFERLIAANQELLSSLASGIKCPLHLRSSE